MVIAATSTGPRRPAVWQRVLLVLVSTLIFLGLIEGLVRVSGVSTEVARNKNFQVAVPVWLLADKDWVQAQARRMEQKAVKASDITWFANFQEARYIGIKLRPNLDAHVVNPFNPIEAEKGVTFHLTSNADGFRGRAFASKTPAALRVVSIGDSSTFGFGVDTEWTYQRLLESRMTGSGYPTEVMNLGIPGQTTRHGLGVLKHYGLELQPDVVIVSFGANDGRLTPRNAEEELAVDETFLGGLRWTMLELRTFQLMRRLIFSLYDPFKPSSSGGQEVSPARRRPLVKAVTHADYSANLEKIHRMAGEAGAKTLFLSICTPDDYVIEMQRTAERLKIPFVNAGAIFRERIDDIIAGKVYPEQVKFYKEIYGEKVMSDNWLYYVTTDGCHPNRVGMSLIADALVGPVGSVLGR